MRRLLPRLFLLTVLSAIVTLHPLIGRAEENSKQYRSLIASALDEYELGNFQEALSLFERAHHLEPSARTLRGMGMASYQARKYVIALGYLQAALDDPRKPLTLQFRREVENALEATRGFIARFELVIAPANAKVTVDGEPIAAMNAQPLQLDPGEHEVVASAPGYKTDARRIKATSGRVGRIELRLAPEQAPEGATASALVNHGRGPAPVVSPQPNVPAAIKALTITGLSFAVIGGGLGAGAGIKTASEEDKLATLCPDKKCSPEHSGQLDRAKRWGTVSTVSLAVGGAGLVAGLVGVVLWARHNKAHPDGARASDRFTPWLFASGAGVQGRF